MIDNLSATSPEFQPEVTDVSGPTSSGSEPPSPPGATKASQRVQKITLVHDHMLEAERCKEWRDAQNLQALITEHLSNECARSVLLADQVAGFRQAVLEKQARDQEYKWTRSQRRRARYLQTKLKTRPAEAVEQLQAFGSGLVVLIDAFQRLIDEVNELGFLTPPVVTRGLQVCGCTEEPAAIAGNPLGYTLLVNNLGATPGVSAADIEPWLAPGRRPAPLRDRPRHELVGADADECRRRLLAALEAERARLDALAERVHGEVDIPGLAEALNRVAILNDAAARSAARAHTEARVTFARSSKDLIKALERGDGHLSSVPGHFSAGSDAKAEETAEAGVARAAAAVEAGLDDQGAGPANPKQGQHETAGDGPSPVACGDDPEISRKPEDVADVPIGNCNETMTYVASPGSGPGCAKLRKTGAEGAPEAAQTGARTVEVPPGTPGEGGGQDAGLRFTPDGPPREGGECGDRPSEPFTHVWRPAQPRPPGSPW
jgi:hypothetical protein